MLRIEAELERKAREANSINVQQKIIGVKTLVLKHSYEIKLMQVVCFYQLNDSPISVWSTLLVENPGVHFINWYAPNA